MTDPVFLDSNILIAAAALEAPFHEPARHALNRLHAKGGPLYISRQVLREVAATLSRAHSWMPAMPGDLLAKQLERDLKVYKLAEENPDATRRLLAYIRDGRAQGRQVHDANIVAVMLASGIKKLVTINVQDFKRFEGEVEVVGVA